MIIPTGATDPRMTTAKRQTLADFLYYSLCSGQTKAGPYGYSPLPLNLVQAGFQQIAKLKKADPKVNLTNRNVTTCHNPTFVAATCRRTTWPRSRRCRPPATSKAPARAAPTPAPTSRPPTTPDAPVRRPAPARRPARRRDRRHGTGERRRRTTDGPGPARVDPATGAVGHRGRQLGGRLRERHDDRARTGRPQDRAFGWLAALELRGAGDGPRHSTWWPARAASEVQR